MIDEAQQRLRLEAASHRCVFCEDVATNWRGRAGDRQYLCDRHGAWRNCSVWYLTKEEKSERVSK